MPILSIFVSLIFASPATRACDSYSIGANKFDLAQQYIGRSSGGDGSPAYTLVTRAMAQKALKDANRAGIRYFRVAAMGYAPAGPEGYGDLSLWIANPHAYWSAIDAMFADLRSADSCIIPVFIWNWVQIPSIVKEPFHELIDNPHSPSWRLLERYVREFVVRYRTNPQLYFYELSNELNLLVDLDNETRCKNRATVTPQCALESNFTTTEMVAFQARLAKLIRSLDSIHKISAGYSIPRDNAQHLSQRPEWSMSGADWSADSAEDFESNLRNINMPVDIISVHLYESNSRRFGIPIGGESAIVSIIAAATHRIGKPLFIGEFGQANVVSNPHNLFVDKIASEITRLQLPYSAVWVWELYQSSTDSPYSTDASSYSLEPGYTDELIANIRKANAHQQSITASAIGSNFDRFPQVVITKPLECAEVTSGAEVFAIASGEHGDDATVSFLLNGTVIAKLVKPPYKFFLPPIDVLATRTAIVEVRRCLPSGSCQSYSTRVRVNSEAKSVAKCAATLVTDSR